jgi:2-dehydro-3-deoxyphosphogluconate aldolase / (4S)-4-hydroxy-2-oxoglutarate aldolase
MGDRRIGTSTGSSAQGDQGSGIQAWRQRLQDHRLVAVIRSPTLDLGWNMALAAMAGGLEILEIAWTGEDPGGLVTRLRQEFPDRSIGVGTLLYPEQLQGAIAAGAQFCFSPHTDPLLIQGAIDRDIPFIPGALTPTEIHQAWRAGATCVKVFPVAQMGGAAYVRSLQGPLGHIPLVPTGGVNQDNLKDLLAAGAVAVGLSQSLFPRPLLQAQDWPAIRALAEGLVALSRRES